MSAPDHSDIERIEKRMKSACKRLHETAAEVATAMTVRDFDSERRKNLLAEFMLPHIKNGDSVSAAETLARASKAYQDRLQQLFSQYELACSTIKMDDAEKTSFKAARSFLARMRVTMDTLPGTEA